MIRVGEDGLSSAGKNRLSSWEIPDYSATSIEGFSPIRFLMASFTERKSHGGIMKPASKLAIAVIFLALSFAAAAAQQKVLLVLKNASEDMGTMLTYEVGVMIGLLQKAGYQPIVATVTGQLLNGGSISLQPDLQFKDVDISDYVGVMVPCMGLGMGKGIAEEGVALVREAADRNLPIAAETGGVEFLSRAGVLKGKHFTIWTGLQYYISGGTFDGTDISQDGNIITASTCPLRATAQKPATTTLLTNRFIDLLSARELR
jgi:protein deglycase